MKSRVFGCFFALVVAIASGARAEEPKGETIDLFNGKDLSNWTFFLNNNGKMEDVWSIKDGVLNCKGHPAGYIRTKDDYTNYVITLEWRFPTKPGNSGVLLRMQGPDKVWPKSIECQLLHQNAGDFWNIDEFQMKTDESRRKDRNTKKMKPSNEKPLGEWNQYEITVDGPNVTLKVNGEVQNEATECAVIPGKICLQSEGAEIEFRNVKLTKLPDRKAQARTTVDVPAGGTLLIGGGEPVVAKENPTLPGLEGWHITGVGHWTYHDGIIEGKQGKDVKTYTHVVSDKSYKDFDASLKFKAVKGNSGFYFRVKIDETGNAHGFQAEIDETRDAGGIYESAGRGWIYKPKKEDADKYFKPQDWNEMTIQARGPKVIVKVNGALASEINEPNVNMEGPFALQIHGGQDVHVMFKDIKIEEK